VAFLHRSTLTDGDNAGMQTSMDFTASYCAGKVRVGNGAAGSVAREERRDTGREAGMVAARQEGKGSRPCFV